MTQEEKARRYDEALEMARKLNKELPCICGVNMCEEIFPEIKESEDEKIRKEIISALKYANHKGVYNKHLDWLEKQGSITQLSEEDQNRFAKDVLTSCALSFINYLDGHKYEGKMCVSNAEWEDIENAFYNAIWDRLHRYYCKYIEKQGEQKHLVNFDEAEKEKYDFVSGQFIECRKSFNEFKEYNSYLLEYIGDDTYIGRSDNILNKKFHITPRQLFTLFTKQHFCWKKEKQSEQKANYTTIMEKSDGRINAIVTRELPTNGYIEQKLDDKVEPKFHEGDWVVQGCSILKIKCVGNTHYCFETVTGYVDDILISELDSQYHLWTIQDAEDGDVLCYESKNEFIIFIYKNGHIHYHCCYNNGHLTTVDSFFVVEKYLLCYIHPATLAQRDLLFEKMKETGYEWDEEKKELKKIEQKSVWDEEIEQKSVWDEEIK